MRRYGKPFGSRFLVIVMISFVVSLTWFVLLGLPNSTSRALSPAQKQLTQTKDVSLRNGKNNAGHALDLAASGSGSPLYRLTGGLRPGRGTPIPPAQDVKDLPVFDISFYNRRGNLISGWLALQAPHAPVIILAHGTPGNRVDMISRAAFLFSHGYNVLLFDFQSYGQSEGTLSTLGMIESEDILAAITYLQAFPDTSDSKIGVLGLSMGATAAVLAAAHTGAIQALVAESCPVDAMQVPGDVPNEQVREADRRLVKLVYNVDIAGARPIDIVGHLAGQTALFFINGDQDAETPLAGMYQLYDAALAPKQYWVVAGAGHAQSFATDSDDYIARVDAFFDRYLSQSS